MEKSILFGLFLTTMMCTVFEANGNIMTFSLTNLRPNQYQYGNGLRDFTRTLDNSPLSNNLYHPWSSMSSMSPSMNNFYNIRPNTSVLTKHKFSFPSGKGVVTQYSNRWDSSSDEIPPFNTNFSPILDSFNRRNQFLDSRYQLMGQLQRIMSNKNPLEIQGNNGDKNNGPTINEKPANGLVNFADNIMGSDTNKQQQQHQQSSVVQQQEQQLSKVVQQQEQQLSKVDQQQQQQLSKVDQQQQQQQQLSKVDQQQQKHKSEEEEEEEEVVEEVVEEEEEEEQQQQQQQQNKPTSISNNSASNGLSKDLINDVRNEVLAQSNNYRRKHNLPEFTIDDELNTVAQDWAEEIGRRDDMKHRPNNKYGENIYMRSESKDLGVKAVDAWYNEMMDFRVGDNEADIAKKSEMFHMTQLLWRSSTKLGVGVSKTANGDYYVVANYDPKGNFVGNFVENLPEITQEHIDTASENAAAEKALLSQF